MLTPEQIDAIVADFVEKVKPYYIDGELKPYGKSTNGIGAQKRTKWPEFWRGYNRAVTERDELKVHIEAGEFPAHLIHKRSPNQTEAEFEYVKANFKQVTLPHYVDYENTILRALHQSNWQLRLEEQAGEPDNDTSFAWYIENGIGELGSLTDWAKYILPKIKTLDPMGVICVMPERLPTTEGMNEEGEPIVVVDPDTLVDPQPVYFDVGRVLGFVRDRYYLLLTMDRSTVTKGGKDEKSGMVLWLVDDTNCYRVAQTGRATDLQFEVSTYFQHDTGYVPVINLMGRPVVMDGAVMWQSHYLPAKDLFDLVLLDSTYLFMSKANSAYPYRVMLGHQCEYTNVSTGARCVGGDLLAFDDDGNEKPGGKCPNCKGTGVAARLGPNGVLFVKEQGAREGGAQTKVQDAMTFVEPAANTLTFLRQEIMENTNEGRRMLHLHSEQPMTGGDTATATEVGVGVKAQMAFIAPIADQLFTIIDFTLDCIGRQRYGINEGLYSVVPATQYELRTEADYVRDMKQAIEAGLPPSVTEEIMRGYVHMRYGSDPYMREAFEAIALADRLLTVNWQQIAAMQGKGEVKGWEVALHYEALSMYDKLMQEQGFAALDTFAKAERMRDYAEEQYGQTQQAQTAGVPALRPSAQLAQQLVDETEQEADSDERRPVETQIKQDMSQDIQQSALNGAQVQSLVEIINQTSTGVITRETAKPLIEAAFPGVDTALIDQMLNGVRPVDPSTLAEVK